MRGTITLVKSIKLFFKPIATGNISIPHLSWRKALWILIIIAISYLLFSSLSIYNKSSQVKRTKWNPYDYYVVFGFNKDMNAMLIDNKGVTYVDYSKIKSLGVDNVVIYNPITIGLQGLRYYQEHKKTHDNDLFTKYLAHSDWLVENISQDGSWYINLDKYLGKYTLNSPWNSAMSQGLGISLLTRSFIDTGNTKYIIAARRALQPFTKYINQGGVTSQNTFGNFYEEYPLPEQPTHVLNGFIYSLFGLYDLYIVDNNSQAKELFDTGIDTLKVVLPDYDLEHWTRYDLHRDRNLKNHWGYSSPWYQKIHVAQLYGLHHITKESIFRQYANKFETQNRNSWINFIIYPAYIVYVHFVKIYRYVIR
jgi:hypothetical protein